MALERTIPAYPFVLPGKVREIELKLARLTGQKDKCLVKSIFSNYFLNSLRHEANLHSYNLSHPEGSFNSYSTHGSGRNVKKGIKSLEAAYNWAKQHIEEVGVNENFLRQIATIVEPSLELDKDGLAKIRSPDRYGQNPVRHLNASWTPPYGQKLPLELERFPREMFEILAPGDIPSALEGAAYAHLHLVRMHLFEDGNSRLARVVQNTILGSNGLPPAIIYPGESLDYSDKIGNAIESWRARTGGAEDPVKGESAFYNYIAGRVSASLDRMLAR